MNGEIDENKKKQIPFRYPAELEKQFEELFKLQWYSKKKNQALIDSLEIAGTLIMKCSKGIKKSAEDSYGNSFQRKLIKEIKKVLRVKTIKIDGTTE